MTANQSPADAVREALDNLVQLIAREYGVTLEVHQRVASVRNAIAALTARVAELESDAERIASCPWRVQKGCTALCQPPKSLSDALQRAEQAEARLAALAGAGPVAWQWRTPDGRWVQCPQNFYDVIVANGEYQARELFTHAPAKAREDEI